MRSRWWLLACFGCSAARTAPSAPIFVEPAGSAAAAVPVVSAPLPAPPAPAPCLPADAELHLSRDGERLVLCAYGETGITGCWNVDRQSGRFAARPIAPQPGIGFHITGGCYEGMCVPAVVPVVTTDDYVFVALHPDGKRAAILSNNRVTLFDRATKKEQRRFPLRKGGNVVGANELSNTAMGLWFVGETVYVRGDDAGPASALFRYSTRGLAVGSHWGLFGGGATVSGDGLVFEENAMLRVTVFDSQSPGGKTAKRSMAGTPCDAPFFQFDFSSLDASDPAQAACAAYLDKHVAAYGRAELLLGGDELVGFAPEVGVFVADATTLLEKSRAPVALCPAPPP